MRRNTIAALALVPALAFAAPACGGHGKQNGTGTNASSDVEKMRAFAKCMRANGVDMPDPSTDGKGSIRLQVRASAGASAANDKTLQTAQSKCRHLQPNGGKPTKVAPADLAKMRAYAKCMREHGVTMPDPDPNGNFSIKSNRSGASAHAGGANPDSQAFKDADKACAHFAPGGGGMHVTRSLN